MTTEQRIAGLRATIEEDLAVIAKLRHQIESAEARLNGRLTLFMQLCEEARAASLLPGGTP
jgi:hypothetical protein